MINLTKKVVACLNHHMVLLMAFRTNSAEETRNVGYVFFLCSFLCSQDTQTVDVYLLQQLPEPVQLGLQLFVVVLQNLHPSLQSSFVLTQQFGLGNELCIAGALRRHREHLRGRRQWGKTLSVVSLLQTVVLRL